MAEYIERYALLNDFYTASRNPWPDFDDAWKLVHNAPSVDVAPVAHGRWIDRPEIKSFKYTNIPVVECTECGIIFCDIINNHNCMYHYCPNCGAKMDGGEER